MRPNFSSDPATFVYSAQVVLPCADLASTIEFFVEQLGFRLERISPADDPAVALLRGPGLELCLERGGAGEPGTLRLLGAPGPDGRTPPPLRAPNGTRIEFAPLQSTLEIPPLRPELVVSRVTGGSPWVVGRAGMQYRDLIPGRLGGRFVASHIRIPDGGPVPDQVHFHSIRFQAIHCVRGSVRVVYEDQGPPFLLEAGDTVLQPPTIRHRVLEASPGLEVMEIACPATHDTHFDHELELPTSPGRKAHALSQRFVRSQGGRTPWRTWSAEGFECRDTGIAAATDGLASVQVVRPVPGSLAPPPSLAHVGELRFLFVLSGSLAITEPGAEAIHLAAADAVTFPAGRDFSLASWSEDLRFLEVRLPAP